MYSFIQTFLWFKIEECKRQRRSRAIMRPGGVASVDDNVRTYLQATQVYSYCPRVQIISRVRVKCFWVTWSGQWSVFVNCWLTLWMFLSLLLCSGSRAMYHSVPKGNYSLAVLRTQQQLVVFWTVTSWFMAVASSRSISLYFNTISFLIWHRVKRATAVRRYSRLRNIFLLHFCLWYNRLACLTLQGDRGRDGFEGQKGEPVSR